MSLMPISLISTAASAAIEALHSHGHKKGVVDPKTAATPGQVQAGSKEQLFKDLFASAQQTASTSPLAKTASKA
jgi:hypothetical protein